VAPRGLIAKSKVVWMASDLSSKARMVHRTDDWQLACCRSPEALSDDGSLEDVGWDTEGVEYVTSKCFLRTSVAKPEKGQLV
jgi:hypothetical protein